MRRLLTVAVMIACAGAVIETYQRAKARTMQGFSPRGTKAARDVWKARSLRSAAPNDAAVGVRTAKSPG